MCAERRLLCFSIDAFFCAKYVFPGYEIVIENPHILYKIGQRTILSVEHSCLINTQRIMLKTIGWKSFKWWCFLVASYFPAGLVCCSVGQYERGIFDCTEQIWNTCRWNSSSHSLWYCVSVICVVGTCVYI